jgi:hypothetical protein
VNPAERVLACLALLLTGCPDTERGGLGPATTTDSGASDSGTPGLVWRQTLDLKEHDLLSLRSPLRFAAQGTRAYVANWGPEVALMNVSDGVLSGPTKLASGSCSLSDVRFSADEKIAVISSYYKWVCSQALTTVLVEDDGTFREPYIATAFPGAGLGKHVAPDFTESIVLHPDGSVYVGFANHHPTTNEVAEKSQIGRVELEADGTFSNPTLFELESGDTKEVTLGLSASGDVLYAVQYDIGKVNRLTVDPITGALSPAGVTTVSANAVLGPICVSGGKENVYVGSAPNGPTGGLHHLRFSGALLEASGSTGIAQHPGLLRVHSIVANADCSQLYVAGERVETYAVVHIFSVDPDTGEPVWVSAVDDVTNLIEEQLLSLHPNGRFLYSVSKWESFVHTFEIVSADVQ